MTQDAQGATALNKEQVYDAEINPLMAQIIGICQAHGIAMLCTFSIPTPDDPDLACTSLLPDESGENDPLHMQCWRALNGSGQSVAITITSPKGDAA
jgi:hypothetical protein